MPGRLDELAGIDELGQLRAAVLTPAPRQLHAQLVAEAIACALGDLLGRVRRHVHGGRDVERLKAEAHQRERELVSFRQAVNGRCHQFGEISQLGGDVRTVGVGLLVGELVGVVPGEPLSVVRRDPPGDDPEPGFEPLGISSAG